MDQITLVKNKYRLEQWINLIRDCKYVLTHMPESEWQRCPEYLEELMPWSESVKAVCAE